MQHDNPTYLLPDFIAGKLSGDEARTVRERLETDDDFRREYERLSTVMSVLDDERNSAQTPQDVSNILIGVNATLDRTNEPVWKRWLRPRVVIPAAVALQVLTVILILALVKTDTGNRHAGEDPLRSALEDIDYSSLVTLEEEVLENQMLADLPVDTDNISVDEEMQDELEDAVNKQLFSEYSYTEVIAASSQYLDEDDLFETITEEEAAAVLKILNKKSLL